MAIGKVNTGGNKEAKLNIFTQLKEPKIKEGVWLKTEYNYKNIVVDKNCYLENMSYKGDENLPYDFQAGDVVAIGTDIYLIGSHESGNDTKFYKFDTLSNTFTKLQDIKYTFSFARAVAVDKEIHFFSETRHYKYSTLTNTFVDIGTLPFNIMFGEAVLVGKSIYLLESNYNYRYDIETNKYTKLANIPFKFTEGSAVHISGNIYILGGYSYGTLKFNYKYNISQNTYTKLKDIPYGFCEGCAVALETNIYLLGGGEEYIGSSFVYKYSTLENTYTKIGELQYNVYCARSVLVNDKIYILGGEKSPRFYQVFLFSSKQYEEGTFILLRSHATQGLYYTELLSLKNKLEGEKFTRMLIGFDDAFLYIGGKLIFPLAYYGNGDRWVEINL